MTKVIAIIQARLSSSRLPGKVLLPIGGRPMLEWVVKRTHRARNVSEVVVATTIDPSDNPIVAFCMGEGFHFTRGSSHDVLDRYYQTARDYGPEIIVRITADCPLIDPGLIDEGVNLLSQVSNSHYSGSSGFDFVANRLPPPWGRTYPIGLDLEVFTFDFLQDAWKSAEAKHQREHVTPYFYEEIPADQLKFKGSNSKLTCAKRQDGRQIALMHHTIDYGDLRWTVDTPEDLELVRAIVSHFPDDTFTWMDVLELVLRKPELNQINAHIRHKNHLDVDDRA